MFLILFLIALVLVPVVSVLTVLVYIGFGLYGGIHCAIEGYKYNIRWGIISIFNMIYEFDLESNYLIFRKSVSYLPECKYNFKYKQE